MGKNKIIIEAKKGSLFDLWAFFLLSPIILFVELYFVYSIVIENKHYYLELFVFSIIFIFLYSKISEIIVITNDGISKPMKIKRKNPKIIPYRDILWYMKKYSLQKDEINGVLVMTKKNKKIRYSDLKTPGCSKILIRYLEEKGIKERTPIKNIEKYH